jgi:serine/threonine protein kinase
VLFKIPNVEDMSETSLQNRLGPVVSERIRLADGKPPSKHSPKEVIQAASFSGLDFNSLKEIAIVGFGKAFPEITPPPTLQCPLNIFPPEVLFGYAASKKSDIWQLACLMFLVHTRTLPFHTEPFYEHLVWHITKYLGPIPSHWAERYRWDKYKSVTYPGETYGRDLAAWFDKGQPTESLESRFSDAPHLSRAERKKLAALLGSMLAWEPGMRLTSGPVLSVL